MLPKLSELSQLQVLTVLMVTLYFKNITFSIPKCAGQKCNLNHLNILIIEMFSDRRHLVAGRDSVLPGGGAGPLPRGEHPRPLQQDPHTAIHIPRGQGISSYTDEVQGDHGGLRPGLC